MQTILMIINAPPYGNERMLSGLRMSLGLMTQEAEKVDLRLFMMSDAVTVALPGHANAQAGGGLEEMLQMLVEQGVQIRLCRTCAQTRGLLDLPLISGVTMGTLVDLSRWTLEADKVITF